MVKYDEDVLKSLIDDAYNYSMKKTADELEELLRYLSKKYYNTGKSLVPDSVYDLIRYVLATKDPKSKFLSEVGSPIAKTTAKLPHFMASLDKIVPDTDYLPRWIKKYPGKYVISDKLDGVSAMLLYKNKTLSLYTRGDGVKGTDISFLIPYVIPDTLKVDKLKDDTAIRGELIISRENFKPLSDKYANARNTVSGLVNSKTYKKRLNIADVTEFIAYQIMYPLHPMSTQMTIMEEYGLDVVEYKSISDKKLSNKYLSEYLTLRRKDAPYDIDGIVVAHDGKKYPIPDHNPKYAFAFKQVMDDQHGETTVLDVVWNVSKDRMLKPVVHVEPIKLVGAVIKYVYAHNAKVIYDGKIGPGAIIQLIRSKDVIPYIQKVITPSSNGEPKMPSCKYEWGETNIDVYMADDERNTDLVIKNLTHFFKKIGTKHLSDGIIRKLVENGYDDVIKIVTIDIKKASKIDGIGKTILSKVKDEIIRSLEEVTLPLLMSASNCFGHGMGSRKLRLITDEIPDIMDVVNDVSKNDMINKLMKIDGFDKKTATKFMDNIDDFIKFFEELNEVYGLQHVLKSEKREGVFSGKKIAFTGFRDKDLEKFIEYYGGSVTTSVSANTLMLVYNGDKTSSKYLKAEKLKIPIVTKTMFEDKFSEHIQKFKEA